ncbi:MAG: chemotaxis protein CheA [Rickettsiales bacterium]|nr:chemotaxis protein CheA [Rickettsiales bacterium]
MDSVRSTFVNEAHELLQELDIALLTLENNPNDSMGVEHVFRVMHTLKGNSKMFDFQMIADAVHDLESVYEAVRTGNRAITRSLLDVSFQALDHLKELLKDPDCLDSANAATHQELLQRLRELSAEKGEITSNVDETMNTYHIFFKPDRDFLMDGSNPLYVLEDLSQLGKVVMIPHISDGDFKVTECQTYWDVVLQTNKGIKAIKEVFVFAEASAQIKITELLVTELVPNVQFAKEVLKTRFKDEPISDIQMKEWAEMFGQIISKKNLTQGNNNTDSKVLSSVRVGSEKLEELMNLVSELITTQASLSLYAEKTQDTGLETITEIFEKLSRRLRDVAFGMTLIPINNLFNRFQRMVRDISNDLGKEVKLISLGGETELDKNIIESLSDPLMHIIRNSVDHGIELPEQRLENGKRAEGRITLKAYYSGVFVYIQIVDDGRGIDVDSVRNKAIEKGLISIEDELSDSEIVDLIFHPGFSTKDSITDLSGRGVGMDVVHKTIQGLRGSISVDSQKGVGSTITIKLPLTLSVIDGLLVSIGGEKYLLPLSVVEKCYEIENSQLINNFNELLVLDDVQYPFINLSGEFGETLDSNKRSQIILVRHNESFVALTCDYIIGEYQAVVKPLGKYFQGQDFVSGATILGDGTIALILDSHKMVELYVERSQHVKKMA